MQATRWRKVLRDIWGNRLRSSLVVLSMTVGLTGIAYGFVTPETLEWLGQTSSAYTQLNLRMAGEPIDARGIQSVLDEVVAKIERGGRTVCAASVRQPGSHPADGLLSNVMLIMGSVSLLALVLSGFLVVNVVSAVLAQQVRQIGLMKAMGARDRQIITMYLIMRAVGASDGALRQLILVEGILAGLFSRAIGTLLALPLGMLLTDLAGRYLLRTRLEYAFSVEGTLAWLVMIVVVSTGPSLLPARSATHLTVREVLAYE